MRVLESVHLGVLRILEIAPELPDGGRLPQIMDVTGLRRLVVGERHAGGVSPPGGAGGAGGSGGPGGGAGGAGGLPGFTIGRGVTEGFCILLCSVTVFSNSL